MQNGTRKGGTLQTSQIINSSPNLEDLWQLHWSYNGGIEHNPAGLFIANVDEPSVIANILTAPPRGGGPVGPPAAAPVAAAPRAGPPPTAVPPTAAPPAGAPSASVPGAQPGGRQGGRGGRGGAQAHPGPAFWIKISARADGSFTVTNSRNNFSKIYKAR
jgi:hypothetical protein